MQKKDLVFLINENITIHQLRKKLNITYQELYKKIFRELDQSLSDYNSDYSQKLLQFIKQVPEEMDTDEIINLLTKTYQKYELRLTGKIKKGELIKLSKINEILDQIEETLNYLRLISNNIPLWQRKQIFKFLEKLIYKERNYTLVNEVIKSFPSLINITNEDNNYLIDGLINNYIETVKKNKQPYQIIYYERVIKLFIDCPHFHISKYHKKELIGRLFSAINQLYKQAIDKKERARITFYLKEIINDLKGVHTATIKDLDFKYNINPIFKHNFFLELYSNMIINGEEYIDCRNKRTITIDSPGTHIFDDACSIEVLPNDNYLLSIFVADPTSYEIDYFPIIDMAHGLGETLYLPYKTIHMLPLDLSEEMSLTAKKNRYAIGYFFEFAPNMECAKFEVKKAIINPDKNMSYKDVNRALDKANDLELYKMLKYMLIVSEHLHNKNAFRKNYETIKNIKNNILKEQDFDFNISYDMGRMIISEFMVLVNEYVSNFFSQNQIPFVYCINNSVSNDNVINELKAKTLKSEPLTEILNYLNTVYTPSQYSNNNTGNTALNLKSYCHATNPLRKFSSFTVSYLINEFMIRKATLSAKKREQLDQYLYNLCIYLNEKEQLNEQYVFEYAKLYYKNK